MFYWDSTDIVQCFRNAAFKCRNSKLDIHPGSISVPQKREIESYLKALSIISLSFKTRAYLPTGLVASPVCWVQQNSYCFFANKYKIGITLLTYNVSETRYSSV